MQQLANYFKEREGVESLITERGFATYLINGDECYIRDLYVHRDFRHQGVASGIADKISKIAKDSGCKYLTGSVMPSANGSTESAEVLIAYGFRLHSSMNNGILFRKDL